MILLALIFLFEAVFFFALFWLRAMANRRVAEQNPFRIPPPSTAGTPWRTGHRTRIKMNPKTYCRSRVACVGGARRGGNLNSAN